MHSDNLRELCATTTNPDYQLVRDGRVSQASRGVISATTSGVDSMGWQIPGTTLAMLARTRLTMVKPLSGQSNFVSTMYDVIEWKKG